METVDDLQLNGLRIIQNDKYFKFGMDAVLLSAFTAEFIKKGDSVTDLGTGTGILPILLCGKSEAANILGVEIQPELAEMASRSVAFNSLSGRITILNADLRSLTGVIAAGSQDVVMSNPPYIKPEHGDRSVNPSRIISRHEIECTAEDVMCTAALLLKYKGILTLVHRPDRLTDVLSAMREYDIEPKLLRMVAPYRGSKPNLFLLKGVKGGKEGGLIVESQLEIYGVREDGSGSNGVYTDEVMRIYGK